jgi:hypothetical protein
VRSRSERFNENHVDVARIDLYGGILETKSREAALSDFWSLDLSKLDAWRCLRDLELEWEAGESDSDDGPPSDEASDFSSLSGDELVPEEDAMRVDAKPVVEVSEREQVRRLAATLNEVVDGRFGAGRAAKTGRRVPGGEQGREDGRRAHEDSVTGREPADVLRAVSCVPPRLSES